MHVPRILTAVMILMAAGVTVMPGQYARNRYALILEDQPVAARFTSHEQLRTAAADGYRRQLDARQLAVHRELQRRNVPIISSVSEVLNAVFVTATPDRLAELSAIPGVIGVRPMRQMHLTLNKATQVMNAPAAWNLVGGQSKAGAGIKIGILDTGIDQNHPAFQDSSLTAPAGFPKCSGSADACSYTNSKVIVARSYVSSIVKGNIADASNPATDSLPDDYSPRDRIGHGSAVASAAAGNVNSGGSITFSGMAPKAWLGNYKIWGSPSVSEPAPEDVWITALNDAVADGMDVINMSSGGTALTGALDTGAACSAGANVPCDPLAMAFENAAKTVVVVVAAGNDGYWAANYPNFNSITSPATAPSVITVGATTNSHVMAPSVKVLSANVPSNLQNIPALPSDSWFQPSGFGANTAPLIDAATAGDAFACKALSPYSLLGAFALVQRGPTGSGACTFDDKAQNVQDAGAIGMIIFNSADSGALRPPFAIEGVEYFVGPVVGLTNADGVALKNYLASNPGVSVVIDRAGIEMDTNAYSQLVGFSPPVVVNQLASYSSFGPSTGDGGIKPEIVATGGLDVNLFPDPLNGYVYPYAGLYMATQRYDPLGDFYSDNGYMAYEGTSFAAPIVAGAAALVKQAHPKYTPAQIKSAIVNTAAQDVTTDTFGSAVDVEWLGAGRLDAGLAANSNITLQVLDQPAAANPAMVATLNFGILKSGTALPITKQVVVTNNGTASVTLAIAVLTGAAASGTTITADKTSLTLAGGAQGTFNVALGGAVPKAGAYSGGVTLQATGVSLRVPYLFLVGTGTPWNFYPLFGSPDGIVGTDAGLVAVKTVDSYGVPAPGTPVVFTVSPRGSLTLRSVAGAPTCSPASSTTRVTCNTDANGIAYADMLLGASPSSSVSVTALAVGYSSSFSGSIRQQPTINANGVLDGGSFTSPIAPGSYVSIFGSNLSDYSDEVTLAPHALPLSLDDVTVSFDVPSAKISVPGHLTYVSPGQVNVQVPWELQGQTSAQVKVTLWGNSPGNVVTVPVADTAPSFFENSGIAAARDLNNATITTSNPAKRGSLIQLYMNGLGPVNGGPASGEYASSTPLVTTKGAPSVSIGGQNAEIQFSGMSPGSPGLYQVNVYVPTGIAAGSASIALTINGVTTKASTLPVN
ncbi:MAG: S8 family serine peptidase [Candidatus Solibacter sp.]